MRMQTSPAKPDLHAAMLHRLSISNYLLIEHLELELSPGFTVVTGETGSGKSILIGALGLVLGQRAEGNLFQDASKRCILELEVREEPGQVFAQQWCEQHGVPMESPMILRRQLEPGGRSRAFVNDTPVRLEQLRELGEGLIHIHSQHHTLLLNDSTFQLGLVDHCAGQAQAVKQYTAQFQLWRAAKEELTRLRMQEAQAQGERDYLQFQFDELEAAHLVPGEQAELEIALARAEHTEELVSALNGMEEGIAGEQAITEQLATIRQNAAKAGRMDPAVQQLLDRLQSTLVELKDMAEEAAHLAGQVVLDPKQAERLRERSDLLARLQHKHRVDGEEALIALHISLKERMAGILSLGGQLEKAEQRTAQVEAQMLQLADVISLQRTKAMEPLAAQVSKQLKELGMPHAIFRFNHQRTAPSAMGVDGIRALFSANKDRPPEPLDKVASGGELSRVMLALIGLAAASKDLPTVVFDEIDTGVSGEVAHRVATLLKAMGHQRQVIAISHLPQIASKADTHLLVTKVQQGDKVRSRIRVLAADERVEALARMLSGKQTTKAALENARELLHGT